VDEKEYLETRLNDQIDWYDRKSSQNQKCFKRLQVATILASAAIPFLSGYIGGPSTFCLKICVGLLGLVVAAITAMLGVYKFHENWLEYRTTCETLKHEKYLFLTRSTPYAEDGNLNLLVERVEGIISKENTAWNKYMKRSKDSHKV
jgi:hypothetical protein